MGGQPAPQRRVAAIDCGTNTLRLLIADLDPASAQPVRQVVREMRTVRLGEGLEASGRFADAALERTRAALVEYAALITAHGATTTRMVATSASRDAANREDLFAIAQRTVGVQPEVVSGDQEGRLTFRGVLSGLRLTGATTVLDIGGGSTEIFVGDGAGADRGVSMDVGVVRLTERHVHCDPPRPDELDRVAQDAAAALREALDRLGGAVRGPVVGVAGTATTAAAIAHRLPDYDPARIHGSRTSYADLLEVQRWACGVRTEDRRAHPAMHPGRAAVFPAGIVILTTMLRLLGADELRASESDILDGIALSIGPPQ